MASPEAQAVIDRMTNPTGSEIAAIEFMVDLWVSRGWWANIVEVYSYGFETATNRRQGWVSHTSTLQGSEAYLGVTGIHLNPNNHIATAVFPSEMYSNNETCLSLFMSTTEAGGNNFDFWGASDGTSEYYLRWRGAQADVQLILGTDFGVRMALPGGPGGFYTTVAGSRDATNKYIKVGANTLVTTDTLPIDSTCPFEIFLNGRNNSGASQGSRTIDLTFVAMFDRVFVGADLAQLEVDMIQYTLVLATEVELEVTPVVVNTESVSNDPSIILLSGLEVTPLVGNTESLNFDPSIIILAPLEVTPVVGNTQSVSNDPSIIILAPFNVEAVVVDTQSESLNPSIKLGEPQRYGKIRARYLTPFSIGYTKIIPDVRYF